MTTKTGIDWQGNWTPQQYAIDAGWTWECIENTARLGISEVDAEVLTPEQQEKLVKYCREAVEMEADEDEQTTMKDNTMSETKPTPGPWEAIPQTNGSRLIANVNEKTGAVRVIAFVQIRPESMTEDVMNAKLIAAAPALLSTLEAIRNDCQKMMDGNDTDPYDIFEAVLNAAGAEIAKAKGTQ